MSPVPSHTDVAIATNSYKQREFSQILVVSYFISQCFVIIGSGSEIYGKYAATESEIRNAAPDHMIWEC